MRRLFEQREFAVDGEHDVGFIFSTLSPSYCINISF